MEAEFGYSQKQQAQRTPERRVSCEHFVVEDLLDFSNDDGVDVHDDNNTNVPLLDDQSTTHNSANSNSSDDSTTGVTPVDSGNSAFSEGNNNDSIFAPVSDIGSQGFSDTQFSGELGVPYDDLAELEWLSNFVEESFSSEDLHKFNIISGMSSAMKSTRLDSESVGASETRYYQVEPQRPESVPSPMFNPEVPVPGKARSKRSRAAPCNWTSRLMVLSNGSPDPQQPMQHMPVPGSPVMKPGRKGPKKKTGLGSGSGSNSGLDVSNGEVRKCLHCATDKTPQWRTGPMGPKTLCNACGVRYKSGRLVPEYRPAASPTFMLTKHSNSHRKVMELRRQKELMKQQHHHQQQYHHQQLMLHHHNTPSSMMFDPSNSDDYLIHQHIGPDYRQLI